MPSSRPSSDRPPTSPTVRVLSLDPRPSGALDACLSRLGVVQLPCGGEDELLSTLPLIVHGRSAFGSAMAGLAEPGLVDGLRTRLASGAPTLAIGTGFQLLFLHSEESPGVEGLGLFEGTLERYGDELPTPQLGWNVAVPEPQSELLEECFAYYANAYAMRRAPREWTAVWSEYDGPFLAGIEKGPVVATQFHPELSGGPGMLLVHNWLQRELVPC